MAASKILYSRILVLLTLTTLSPVELVYAQNPASQRSASQNLAAPTPLANIQDSLIVGTPQAVLLKKTDRILIGTVRQNGNYIEIEIADQSRVSIPRDQIDYVGVDTEDVYQFKRRSIDRWAVGDHFKLTRWCLQNQLLRQATEHYLEVVKQNADHPAVKQLGAELEQKILADEKFRVYVGLPPLTPAPSLTAASSTESRAVTTASATSSLAAHPEVAMRFNDRVQPILLNRCSQAACHGTSSDNALRLIEPVGKAFARVSSENMKHVLALIKPIPDGTPKLLHFATKPHGLQREPGIALAETMLIEELKAWIRFSENPVVPAVASIAAVSEPLNNAPKLNPIAPGSSPLRAVPDAAKRVEFPAGTVRPATNEIDALDAQLKEILAKEKFSPNQGPRDPFDPAEFNRQANPPR
jgi:hypothetical protein